MNAPRQLLPRAAELAREPGDIQIPINQDLLDFFGAHRYSRGRVASATRGPHTTRNVESCQSENSQNVKKREETPFGRRLREAFGGANNASIARLLKQGNSAITNYMAGRMPPPETLLEISKFTNCSIHWLLTGEGAKKVEPAVAEPRAEYQTAPLEIRPSPAVQAALKELAQRNGLSIDEQISRVVLNGLVASDLVEIAEPRTARYILMDMMELTTRAGKTREKTKRRRAK